jgi:3-phenylpropionate/trans-cinnamate dioxygenase ferredoxin component
LVGQSPSKPNYFLTTQKALCRGTFDCNLELLEYEIPVGKMKATKLDGEEILIANVGGNYYAIGFKCTHSGGDLSQGTLEGNIVTCPKHNAKFDVTTGKVVSHPKMGLFHPKANDETTCQVKVENENILVKL